MLGTSNNTIQVLVRVRVSGANSTFVANPKVGRVEMLKYCLANLEFRNIVTKLAKLFIEAIALFLAARLSRRRCLLHVEVPECTGQHFPTDP